VTAAAEVLVRPAEQADADALGRCHVACWREAYTGRVDAGQLAVLVGDVAGRTESWRRILARRPRTLLAVAGAEVVGFASVGPQRDPDLDVPTELYALYLREARWGTGLGSRLLRTALGEVAASLWVLADNPRAERCYLRHGFVRDGALKHDPRFGADEVRMVRAGGSAG